jgi:predicted tellurium resistance membrane protein TerC
MGTSTWITANMAPTLVGGSSMSAYLSAGLSIILVFVGVKFMVSDLVGKVPIWVSLPFIAIVITVSIAASLWKTRGMVRETLPGSQSTTKESCHERTGVGEG